MKRVLERRATAATLDFSAWQLPTSSHLTTSSPFVVCYLILFNIIVKKIICIKSFILLIALLIKGCGKKALIFWFTWVCNLTVLKRCTGVSSTWWMICRNVASQLSRIPLWRSFESRRLFNKEGGPFIPQRRRLSSTTAFGCYNISGLICSSLESRWQERGGM